MSRKQGYQGHRDGGYTVQCWCGATTQWQRMDAFLRGDRVLCSDRCGDYRPLEREHLMERAAPKPE